MRCGVRNLCPTLLQAGIKRDTLAQKYLGRACLELGDSSSLE